MAEGHYQHPGLYREDVFAAPEFRLLTGVPAFLGFAAQGPENVPQPLTVWPQFADMFGAPLANGYLSQAVRGFFDNGGGICYVIRLRESRHALAALQEGLALLEPLEDIDLLCAPDIVRPARPGSAPVESECLEMQRAVLAHCEQQGERVALLDTLPNAAVEDVVRQRQALQGRGVTGTNGTLYYPWIWVAQGDTAGGKAKIPPCGHVAGVYARTDRQSGVHKAPANAILEGVVDLESSLSDVQQSRLHPHGVNCLRVFPGRGIRIWGARTLSQEPAWTYVNVRRLFLTAGRWIEATMADATFEPNDFLLWVRLERELRAYFGGLFRQGALQGATEEEAFYVKCDAETNPPEVRAAGQVITEIGLAPTIPSEFVVVRLIHGASGMRVSGPQ